MCAEFKPKLEKLQYLSSIDDAISGLQSYTNVVAGRSADDMHTAGSSRGKRQTLTNFDEGGIFSDAKAICEVLNDSAA